jgi:hypothetical protein
MVQHHGGDKIRRARQRATNGRDAVISGWWLGLLAIQHWPLPVLLHGASASNPASGNTF